MNSKWTLILLVFIGSLQISTVIAGDFGRFVGTVKTEWIEHDRKMRLLEDFAYIDPFGKEWEAPKGSIIDGASIPRFLWTVVGSPFTGEYREASVVHDVACVEKSRPWKSVHRMFYYASRLGGVKEIKGKLMYAAVRKFGPRWDSDGTPIRLAEVTVAEQERDLEAIRKFIEKENPSLDEIDSLVDK